MESLAEQPVQEKAKSFNLLASVEMLRFDLEQFGYVLPETRQRVSDTELSYLSEGVDRAARTTFAFKREGDDMLYFDRGKWSPYSVMLLQGLRTAESEADADHRRRFLVEWAQNDLYNYYQIRKLQPGQQHVWCSMYPYDEEKKHGGKFLQDCGLQMDRKMGFLYRAYCRDDGYIVMESQTVDGVDENDGQAYATAMKVADENPSAELDEITEAYDNEQMRLHGGYFYAGRREASKDENVWNEIRANRDLADYLLEKLENLAGQFIPREQLEVATKKLIYGVWALFKKRLDGTATYDVTEPLLNVGINFIHGLDHQVYAAFQEFASRGKILVGCGGSIEFLAGEEDILNAPTGDVFSAIFGKKAENPESKYSFKVRMFCVACQAPPNKNEKKYDMKKMCGPCGLCRKCDYKARVK